MLKLALAVGVVTWLVKRGGLDFSQLRNVQERWHWFVLAQVPFGFVLALTATRWWILLRSQGIPYSLRDTFALTMIGWVFNQVMLGTLGGDMVKAYLVGREQPQSRSAAVISVFVDRILGLMVLLLIALVAIGCNLERVSQNEALAVVAWAVLGVFLAGVLGVGLYFAPGVRSLGVVVWTLRKLPFQGLLQKIDAAVYAYRDQRRTLLLVLLLSVALQSSVVLMSLCLAHALLGEPFHWPTFFFVIPVANVLVALPINPPGAVGTAEAIYGKLFEYAGVPHGALLCVLQRFTFVLWALFGLVFYLRRRANINEAVEEAKRAEEDSGQQRDEPSRTLVANAPEQQT